MKDVKNGADAIMLVIGMMGIIMGIGLLIMLAQL